MTSPELLSATQTKALQSSLEELALEFNPDGRFICLSASHWRGFSDNDMAISTQHRSEHGWKYEESNAGKKSQTASDAPVQDASVMWRERRAFAYYFQHAAPFVGGDLDVGFWSTIVPQVCRSEPAVWDAIISISALFESPEPWPKLFFPRLEDPRTLNQNHRDALSWYSRSVSAVRQRIKRGDVDIFVGLISCVLFICIECLQGASKEALQLYRQGVHLILALRTKIACGVVPAFKASLLEDTIVPIFVRLGAIAISVSAVPVRDLLRDTGHALTHKFVSLKTARETIVLLATEAQLFDILALSIY
ncbi:uncharacterized protein ATNIH1004_000761 [Aspergillus tanneri]|uniref:Transcription factor domain-containing protein n=1 Tax=Aspergillus tanneri TaxID=1220188 RepID=A0A5M9N3T9_9EURO|nr:uncharacterized protein ATNIH1004_000761 [Aspergillus tanneri]KAA8651863.1 hypothetical protein ATNIH1004_000761 [Aspergillus tanneri]